MATTTAFTGRRLLFIGMAMAGALGILIRNDLRLRAISGFGVADLQGAHRPADFARLIDAWRAAGAEAMARAGFSLGWDYCFMMLYGAFFIGAAFFATAESGRYRWAVQIVAVAMAIGTLLDGIENILQLEMLWHGVESAPARWASIVTATKWALVAPCMLLVAVALPLKGIRALYNR